MTKDWQQGDRFLEMRSRWFTLLGEHWLDHQGQTLEYWRVERAHSVIVLPLHKNQILLPPPTYRPGIGTVTYDFPGGRLPDGELPEAAAIAILQRELDIEPDAIANLSPLNSEGWAINSSFSNQRLYSWVAHLSEDREVPLKQDSFSIPTSSTGIQTLLNILTCLQCRAILLEWWLIQRAQQDSNL